MEVKEFTSSFQSRVKNLVISIHKEFGFPYDFRLDYDLDNPDKYYKKEGGVFYILVDDNKLIGTVALKRLGERDAELKRLYLKKKYRGRGLGQKLLNKALDFCRVKGIKRVVLDTNKKQVKAQKLYEKFGFGIDKVVNNTIYMSKDF